MGLTESKPLWDSFNRARVAEAFRFLRQFTRHRERRKDATLPGDTHKLNQLSRLNPVPKTPNTGPIV